jgi:hypothetical protein
MKSSFVMFSAGESPWNRMTTRSASSREARPCCTALFWTFSPCSSVPVRKNTFCPFIRWYRASASHAIVV